MPYDIAELAGDYQLVPRTVTWTGAVKQQLCQLNVHRPLIYLSGQQANGWNIYLASDQDRVPPIWTFGGTFTAKFTWIDDGVVCTQELWAEPTSPLGSAPSISVLEVWWMPQ